MALYICDGSFEGILTSVFHAFSRKDMQGSILPEWEFTGASLFDVVQVATDTALSDRVWNGVQDKISYNALKDIYYVYLSDKTESGDIILRYLADGFEHGRSIRSRFDLDSVRRVMEIRKKVIGEAHRFLGLLRFKKLESEAYLADFEPDHNIIALVSPHFARRFHAQNWLIRDLKRRVGAFYLASSQEWTIASLSQEELSLRPSDDFETLWKKYHKTVTIHERRNPQLQARMMPRRYWKHLTEFENE